MQPDPLAVYVFVVAPLLALTVSVVGSVPVVVAVGQRWLLLLVAVPVVMIGAQVLELLAVVETGTVPGTPGGEFVETAVNALTPGAVYYGLTVTRDRAALSERRSDHPDPHERLVSDALSPGGAVPDRVGRGADPPGAAYVAGGRAAGRLTSAGVWRRSSVP